MSNDYTNPDYTNPNTNPKTITMLNDPNGPSRANEEICFHNSNKENFNDSVHANY